ncbi:MAG: hypothetical protein ABW098_07910 [Candidatus Thiodiazotropha sp.]
MFVAPSPWLVLGLKVPFYIFVTVSYPHDAYWLIAKPELFGKRLIALFVLEFSVVKQRNGYLDAPMHMLSLNNS